MITSQELAVNPHQQYRNSPVHDNENAPVWWTEYVTMLLYNAFPHGFGMACRYMIYGTCHHTKYC